MAPTQLAAASFVGASKKLYIYKMKHPQNPSDCVGAIKFPGILMWLVYVFFSITPLPNRNSCGK